MDFSNRDNRPTQQPQQTNTSSFNNRPTQQPVEQKSRFSRPSGDGTNSLGKIGSIVLLFGVAILAAALVIALVFGGDIKSDNAESSLINRNQYQAIFLDSQDGQVYFGKLAIYNDDTYVLNDIFYVRVENPIQPQGTEQQQPNISLAKLGNELHGPEDIMFIARDKVLYWENLKDDGQVVTAIKNYKQNGEQTQTQPQNQQTEDTTQEQTDNSGAAGTQPAGTPQQNDTPDTTQTTPAPETTTDPTAPAQ